MQTLYCFLCLLQRDSHEDGTEFIVTNVDQGDTLAGEWLRKDSHEDGTEFIVTNVDQGNTLAGEWLRKLFENMKTFHTQLETFEKQFIDKESISQKDIADLKGAFEDHVTKFQKHCEEAAMRQDMQKLSSKIDRLSRENEELRSKLKTTKEKYESLAKDIEKIRQPSLEGDAAGDNASTPITALLSTLDELAAQMVPKETTNKRRSMMESHDNELHTAHGILIQDNFDDSTTESLTLPRTYGASSFGRGTLSRGDSNKPLFSIDEDEQSQSEDQVSSQATDVQQSLPPSASKVLLRPKKTSTPGVKRTQSIISEKEHNCLGVVWAMSDLTVAIKKLLETDSSN